MLFVESDSIRTWLTVRFSAGEKDFNSMKQKKKVISNTKIAIIFFIILLFFAGLSLTFKLILVLREGKFDDGRRFTLSVSNSKNFEVISLSPSLKNIIIFRLPSMKSNEAVRLLEIPIEGFVISDSLDLNQKVDSVFLKSILNYNNLKTNFTLIDLLRIFAFVWTVPESNVNIRNITPDLDTGRIDKIVGSLASDELIGKEGKTIQIINGTNIGGLGNRLARLISNMGGNVIIVATSDTTKKRSKISYIGEKSYTVEKLNKVLGYELVLEIDNAISDVTIVIGEDKANSSPF